MLYFFCPVGFECPVARVDMPGYLPGSYPPGRLMRVRLMAEVTQGPLRGGWATVFKVAQRGVKPYKADIKPVLPVKTMSLGESMVSGILGCLGKELKIENHLFISAHLQMPAATCTEGVEVSPSPTRALTNQSNG